LNQRLQAVSRPHRNLVNGNAFVGNSLNTRHRASMPLIKRVGRLLPVVKIVKSLAIQVALWQLGGRVATI
jgi:hypothetical protein